MEEGDKVQNFTKKVLGFQEKHVLPVSNQDLRHLLSGVADPSQVYLLLKLTTEEVT
jgi:hypothetical protein